MDGGTIAFDFRLAVSNRKVWMGMDTLRISIDGWDDLSLLVRMAILFSDFIFIDSLDVCGTWNPECCGLCDTRGDGLAEF